MPHSKSTADQDLPVIMPDPAAATKSKRVPVEHLFTPAPDGVELAIYFLVVLGVVGGIIIPQGMALSSHCTEDEHCAARLSSAWIPGASFYDSSDAQYRDFTSNAPLLCGVAALASGVGWALRRSGSPWLQQCWYAILSTAFIVLAHGIHGIFPVLAVVITYGITKTAGPAVPGLVWGVGLSFLLAIGINGATWFKFAFLLGDLGRPLDAYTGLFSFSWQGPFNLLMLRLVSFALDHHWASMPKGTCPIKVGARDEPWGYSWRVKTHHKPEEYSLLHLFNYCFYLPLYFAGPTITFNAWLSYAKHANAEASVRDVALYAGRVLASWLLLELGLHFIPTFALSYSKAYAHLTPLGTSVLGFWALHFLWLKFVVIWRFFRLWALTDGVQPVENMNRCISNMLSNKQFWRMWHRSFNRWLVRYVYVPLGGSGVSGLAQAGNTVLVFVFVALWHEVNWKLLAWGLTSGLIFAPEIALNKFAMLPAVKPHWETWYYRAAKALVQSQNTYLVMMWNILGFSVGLEGAVTYFSKVLSPAGLPVYFGITAFYFCVVQLRFAWRKAEIVAAEAKGQFVEPAH